MVSSAIYINVINASCGILLSNSLMISCVKLATHVRAINLRSFQADYYDYVLSSSCSNIARQHINLETSSKTCASFWPVCHQF